MWPEGMKNTKKKIKIRANGKMGKLANTAFKIAPVVIAGLENNLNTASMFITSKEAIL